MDHHSFSKPDQPADTYSQGQGYPGPPSYPVPKSERKHSGPGIASFIISLVAVIGYVVSFVIAGSMIAPVINEARDSLDTYSESFIFLGAAVLALAALNVIGVVVGIIGLALRDRKKVFAILGTIINGLIILLFMLLIASVLVNAGAM